MSGVFEWSDSAHMGYNQVSSLGGGRHEESMITRTFVLCTLIELSQPHGGVAGFV